MLKKYLHHLLKTLYCALFFFVPLLWTPFTRELFEFPKMIAVYFFTGWIVFVFVVKSLIQGRLSIRRTPLDAPILLFVFVYILATVFSIHFETSFFGYYTRFHGGLLSLFCYVFLFYIFVSEFSNLEPFLFSMFLSAGLVSIWGVLEHFGIDKDYWVQDVQSRVFSTLGQPNWLAAFLAMLIPVILCWGLYFVRKGRWKYACFLGFLSFIYYLSFWFAYSLSGLAGLLLGMIVMIALLRTRLDLNQKKYLVVTIFAFFVFSCLFPGLFEARINQIKDILANELAVFAQTAVPSHSGSTTRIRLLVWGGALQTFMSRPVLGHGPETFAYSFLPQRPAGLNSTDEWDFLYNKAHNEYLDLLCNTGVLGLLSFLAIVVVAFACFAKRSLKWAPLSVGFFSGIAVYLASNFFGFSVVATALLFWAFLAFIVVSAEQDSSYRQLELSSMLQRVIIGAFMVVSILFFDFFVFRSFWADVIYARGQALEAAGEYLLASAEINKASRLRPTEPTYLRDLSENLANAALVAGSIESQQYLASWASDAAQQAYAINPLNSLTLKQLTRVYYDLALVDSTYVSSAQRVASEMVRLSPTDAKAYYNLGLVCILQGADEDAKAALEKAIELRPQYTEAREVLDSLETLEEL